MSLHAAPEWLSSLERGLPPRYDDGLRRVRWARVVPIAIRFDVEWRAFGRAPLRSAMSTRDLDAAIMSACVAEADGLRRVGHDMRTAIADYLAAERRLSGQPEIY